VKSECIKRRVNCKNLALGCVEVLPLDELEDHLEKTCTKRVVECRLECGTKVVCDKRTDHEVGVFRVVRYLPRLSRFALFCQRNHCIMRLAVCRRGCGEWVFMKEEDKHFEVCVKRIVEVCGLVFMLIGMI
jgi:hypothetical protein